MQRGAVYICHKDRLDMFKSFGFKPPALSEVMSCNATHELSTAAFGTERKRVLRVNIYCSARPFKINVTAHTYPIPSADVS